MGGRGGRGGGAVAQNPRLAAALEATARGRVFLCKPGDKAPLHKGWRASATTDPATIRGAFAAHPDANYGVIPHPGLFIVDRDGGPLPFELPRTLIVLTGSTTPGRPKTHEWFALPPELRGYTVKGQISAAPKVDIIGQMGAPPYAVGVGSVTKAPYLWVGGRGPLDAPIATAPPELIALLQARGLLIQPAGLQGSRPAPKADPAATRASVAERRRHDPANAGCGAARDSETMHKPLQIGQRNRGLFEHGCRLRRQGATAEQITAELQAWNATICHPPLPGDEVDAIAASAARYPAGDGQSDNAATNARARAFEYAELATICRWRGTAGATRRAVLFAMLRIAYRAARTTVSASVRQVAEEARVTRDTAHRHLDALRRGGWLLHICPECQRSDGWRRGPKHTAPVCGHHDHADGERVSDRTGRRYFAPYTYRLTRPKTPELVLHTQDTSPRKGGGVALVSLLRNTPSDACRWGKGRLGQTATPVLAALDQQAWPSARALAEALGVAPSTATRTLAKLEAHGLAERDDTGGWRRGPAALDDVARTLPSHGAGERQRAQHEREREAYRAHRADRQARRERTITPTLVDAGTGEQIDTTTGELIEAPALYQRWRAKRPSKALAGPQDARDGQTDRQRSPRTHDHESVGPRTPTRNGGFL